ncbi:hypothetical protein QJS10_CPA05g00620 [Acorus calamus]|uniref:DNA gyrase subunit A n=1 Tax=Acorus calamus TaxID=4465 RepID=A0AAV9ETR3_ACOCL|nr:hypothetical protein QJS10_CPA05g00620 [Acorus calamus]
MEQKNKGSACHETERRGKELRPPWLLQLCLKVVIGKRVQPIMYMLSAWCNNNSHKKTFKGTFFMYLRLAEDGESDEQVVLVSQSGTINRIKVRDISIQSRYARGVILMRLEHTGRIQSVSLISGAEADPEVDE